MIDLDLKKHKDRLKIRREGDQRLIFDLIRKKWVVLQPEELVRQLLVHYLLLDMQYNQNRIIIEKGLKVNKMEKRCDILVYDEGMSPFLLVECKAPHINITQGVFKQIAWYNMPLKVEYLLVTNGVDTFCCRMDYKQKSFEFLGAIPEFPMQA